MHRNEKWRRAAVVLGLIFVGVSLASCGITGGLRGNPGYARFGSVDAHGADREFALSLGPLPLQVAKAFARYEPELAAMLKGVRAVRVYAYTVEDDDARAGEYLDAVTRRLVDDGWERVVAVRDDGERVAVLVRMADRSAAIRGVAVVVYDESDLMLVNVIGNIRPETITELMAGLDLDVPAMSIGSERSSSAALNR